MQQSSFWCPSDSHQKEAARQAQTRKRSSRWSCASATEVIPCFERRVCHLDDHFIRSQAVRLNDDERPSRLAASSRVRVVRCVIFFGPENKSLARRRPGDADDLLIDLRPRVTGERHRNGNARLQNKIWAKQQKQQQQKNDVEQGEKHEPTEVMFLRPAELHARTEVIIGF